MDKEFLYRYFNRETSEEEEAILADWIDQSNGNKNIFQKEHEYYNMMLLVGEKKQFSTSPKTRLFLVWIKEFAKIASVVIIMIIFGYFYQTRNITDLAAPTSKINVPPGQRVNVILPDGTGVTINAMSEIEYPSLFANGERRIKLTGEAFFDVVHDNNKPFIVETYEYDIVVLGTKFNVESYRDKDIFTTSLLEGKVKIVNKENSHVFTTLESNQQVKSINNTLKITSIEDYDILRWREGLICFKNKPFKLLMEQFEKYFDVEIVINNNKLLERQLSGKIRINDGIENALRIIQKNTAFSYKFDSDKENVIYIN